MTFKPGDTLPDLTLANAHDKATPLAAAPGHQLVVYFYPKDNTPGCTTEGQDFTRLHAEFANVNTDIIGISRDSARSHLGFAEKHSFPFTLLADTEETACKAFDVIHEKKNYGRVYMGIVRSTFLFDAGGVLAQEWRGVRVKGHVEAVLEAARALQA